MLADRLQVDALVAYRDRDGQHTARRITVRSLHGDRDPRTRFIYARVAYAHCHLRGEPRHFIVSRIGALADPETGEVFEGVRDIAGWLRAKAGVLTPQERRMAALSGRDAPSPPGCARRAG